MSDINVWFVEERNPFGEWSPVLYNGPQPPLQRRSEGSRKVFRRPPVPVHPFHWACDLRMLQALYGGDNPSLPVKGGDDADED
jgi:hypothetical protein